MNTAPTLHTLEAEVFAALSAAALPYDPTRSILLGMHAVSTALKAGEPVPFAADRALRDAIWRSRLRLVLFDGEPRIEVSCAAWSRDGKRIYAGSDGGPTVAVDATTGERIWSSPAIDGPPATSVLALAVSPDGTTVAAGGLKNQVVLLRADDGTPSATLAVGAYVSGLAFSPDGRRLAVLTQDSIGVWDVATSTLAITLRADGVQEFAWSPDGQQIASCGQGIQLWDAGTATLIRPVGPERQVRHLAWSPDGSRLAVSLDASCEVWDLGSGQLVLAGSSFTVDGGRLAFSPDGRRLAKRGFGHSTTVFDATDGSLVAKLGGHLPGDYESSLAWSPDGDRLLSGKAFSGPVGYSAIRAPRNKGGYSCLKVWDVGVADGHDGDEWQSLRMPQPVNSNAWSPDGTTIAVACGDSVRILDGESGAERRRFPLQPGSSGVGLSWSSDGEWLVVDEVRGDKSSRRIWSFASGEELTALPGTDGAVAVSGLSDMHWSADGRRMSARHSGDRVSVWDLAARKVVFELPGAFPAIASALTRDGLRLATISGNVEAARVWEVDPGVVLRTLGSDVPFSDPSGRQNFFHQPLGIAWLPEGDRLTVITVASVVVWNSADGTRSYAFDNPPGFLSFVFSPDRTRLVLMTLCGSQTTIGIVAPAGASPVLSVWDLDRGQRLAQPKFLDYYPPIPPPEVSWSPDGRLLATVWPEPIGLYDGKKSPDWGGIERFVRVSDALTGEEVFAVSPVVPDRITWRPDGKRLVCIRGDRLQYFLPDPHDLLALARTRVWRNFTFDECVQYFDGNDPPPIP